MCGRFCCALDPADIRTELNRAHVIDNQDTEWVDQDRYRSSYNVCPSRYVPTVLEKDYQHTRHIQSMQWGFIPSWTTHVPYTKPINARSETLAERPSIFDKAKNVFRCIIAAEGFYEWNRARRAFYVKRKDEQLMLFAGLYSTSSVEGECVTTCTIVTTSASKAFSEIHNRMPVILDPSKVDQWLNKEIQWTPSISELLKPFDGDLVFYQVPNDVGSVNNDDSSLNKPLDKQKGSISQFLKPVNLSEVMDVEKQKSDVVPRTRDGEDIPHKSKRRKGSLDSAVPDTSLPKITDFFSKK